MDNQADVAFKVTRSGEKPSRETQAATNELESLQEVVTTTAEVQELTEAQKNFALLLGRLLATMWREEQQHHLKKAP